MKRVKEEIAIAELFKKRNPLLAKVDTGSSGGSKEKWQKIRKKLKIINSSKVTIASEVEPEKHDIEDVGDKV